jgi:hypothetical protein
MYSFISTNSIYAMSKKHACWGRNGLKDERNHRDESSNIRKLDEVIQTRKFEN